MDSLNESTELFLLDQMLLGRAAWTRIKHRQELRRYGRWLADRDWRAVTPRELQSYVRTRAHLGASARAGTIGSLRVFYAWAAIEGYVVVSPAAGLRIPTRPQPTPRALTIAQVRQLVAHLARQTGLRARRDEACLLAALYAGLRACELAKLRWGDVDLDAGVIVVRLSKWHHGRVVPIHPALRPILVAWQATQALGADAPVFGDTHEDSTAGRPITAARVGKIARAAKVATGLPLTAHVLRHTFATWTLRRSKDLYAVSKALGHSNVKVTEVYLSADTDQIAEAIGSLPSPQDW
jgi:site-specific recombinase XerD